MFAWPGTVGCEDVVRSRNRAGTASHPPVGSSWRCEGGTTQRRRALGGPASKTARVHRSRAVGPFDPSNSPTRPVAKVGSAHVCPAPDLGGYWADDVAGES